MTEKEKMLAGQLYDPGEETLCRERQKAKGLCFEFNRLHPDDRAAQTDILKRLLGGIGERFHLEAPFFCDYGRYIRVGENFYANHNCVILDGGGVEIGDNVLFAPNVGVYTAGHPLDVERRNAGLEYAYPVKIGNNVWIGADVSILPGVEIGDNTVVGAGSVVNRSLPGNVLAAGNPCRVIREITDGDRETSLKWAERGVRHG
ncbi:MAG: sugar O-acetyltransferase [Candidatus Merdivicinus sp.]|jgi:maltose O-acetyltransferase